MDMHMTVQLFCCINFTSNLIILKQMT